MGEAKRRREQGAQGPASRVARRAAPKAPEPDLRLVASASEVSLASYLVDFAGTMGISRYRAQTAAIAYVTKVPTGRLLGRVVEVCQVPDGFPIPERLQDPRKTPPPLPNAEAVRTLLDAITNAEAPEQPASIEVPAPAESAG